jgi:hypothetical protein
MPALWPKFIPELANTIMSQQFTKPGGAILSYPLPKVGTDQVPIFPPSGDLIKSIAPGNPINGQLTTNPAGMINAINLAPLSGRYDFGKAVAQHYIDAVKGAPKAQTPFGAFHANNGLAELILKEGYGIAFERLLKEGDIPLMDQYDEDGNLTQMGKESHPAYADFCPDVDAPPDEEELAEMRKKNDLAFNKFVDSKKTEYNLHKFRFFQFPCLLGGESQSDLEKIFASRLLQQFERITNRTTKWEFYIWVACLGKENYSNSSGFGGGWSGMPYPNINTQARTDINAAGYDWRKLADNVSKLVTDAILEVHPERETNTSMFFNTSVLKRRIKADPSGPITLPHNLECPLNEYKIQVPYDFEHSPPENPSARPKVLTSNVVATFSWYPNKRTGSFSISNANDPPIITNAPKFTKTENWVKSKYENDEWKNHWRKVPANKLAAAAQKPDAQAAFFEIDPKPEGTLFKFEYHKAKCAKEAAAACEEDAAAVDHPFEPSGTTPGGKSFSGDPYEMMAKVTIAYWYACIVKPFGPMPAALPAMINAPLGGLYIPIYYGSANRLANNLRKAWNTGKVFNKVPMTQPPAFATSTAVAGAYALHLLEFKLLYLGGIPTPVGPVPMVGFVPVVF